MNASGVVEKIPEALVRAKAAEAVELPADLLASEVEMPRMLEAITLRPDLMDADMRRIFDGDDGAEPLDDDFVAQMIDATGEGDEDGGAEADGESNADAFDFNAHVNRLMRQASADADDEAEEEEEDDDDDDREARQGPARVLRTVDEHFAAVLQEYDDDAADDDDDDGRDMHGALQAADRIVQDAMQSFLRDAAEQHSVGNVAHPPPRNEILASARLERGVAAAASDDDGPEAEGDVMDAWGTYKTTVKPQYDCETIVTTLSVLDNHPAMIDVPGGRRRRHKQGAKAPQSPALSAAADSLARDVARLTIEAIAERVKGESAEQKKARKGAVKAARKERRVEKKQLKNEFKHEKQRLVHALTAPNAPKSGVSEFKI